MTDTGAMRVCMISDDFLPAATGVGTHLQQISSLLAERGHTVLVVTTRRKGEPERERWRGVDVLRVPTVKMFGFYQAMPSKGLLTRIFDEFNPDLAHFHYLGVMMVRAMDVTEGRSLPRIYTYHMTEDHLTQPLPMRPFRSLIAKWIVRLCNRCNQIISVSQGIAKTLPRKGIHTPVQYISNPVTFESVDDVKPVDSKGKFAILFAGRLNPEKNIPLLIRAFARLVEQVPDVCLWVAGEGSQRRALESLGNQLGVSAQISFLGFLPHEQLSGYYAGCHVFVLPSIVETQGLVAMEAMWFGKPIIVARSVISAEELVDDGHNGFIVDHESDAELANRLAELAADDAKRARMGTAGRQKAQAYRPPAILAELEALYSAVRGHSHGAS